MRNTKEKARKLELKVGESVQVKFLSDQPFEGEGEYGPWWLYQVEVGGEKFSFFPRREAHEKIQELGLKKGDRALISMRAEEGESGKLRKVMEVKPIREEDELEAPLPWEKEREKPGEEPSQIDFAGVLEESLEEALAIAGAQGLAIPEVVQRLTSTLFIAKLQHGYIAPQPQPTTNNFRFLKEVGELKKQVGGEMYYIILGTVSKKLGVRYHHANEIVDRAHQAEFYKALKEYVESVRTGGQGGRDEGA